MYDSSGLLSKLTGLITLHLPPLEHGLPSTVVGIIFLMIWVLTALRDLNQALHHLHMWTQNPTTPQRPPHTWRSSLSAFSVIILHVWPENEFKFKSQGPVWSTKHLEQQKQKASFLKLSTLYFFGLWNMNKLNTFLFYLCEEIQLPGSLCYSTTSL